MYNTILITIPWAGPPSLIEYRIKVDRQKLPPVLESQAANASLCAHIFGYKSKQITSTVVFCSSCAKSPYIYARKTDTSEH